MQVFIYSSPDESDIPLQFNDVDDVHQIDDSMYLDLATAVIESGRRTLFVNMKHVIALKINNGESSIEDDSEDEA